MPTVATCHYPGMFFACEWHSLVCQFVQNWKSRSVDGGKKYRGCLSRATGPTSGPHRPRVGGSMIEGYARGLQRRTAEDEGCYQPDGGRGRITPQLVSVSASGRSVSYVFSRPTKGVGMVLASSHHSTDAGSVVVLDVESRGSKSERNCLWPANLSEPGLLGRGDLGTCSPASNQVAQLFRAGGKLADRRADYFFG